MFYIGLIVGLSAGMVLCTIFYMWLMKVALSDVRGKSRDEFLEVQRKNGEHIAAIVDAIERAAK